MSFQNFLSPNPNDKFLWVRFGALGDVLEALTCAFLVKQKFPDVRMSFLTTPPYVGIVKSQPYIDDVICGEKSPVAEMMKTAALLREKKYDWIGSTFKGSHMPFLSFFGGVKNRLGSSKYFPFIDTCNVYKWANANGIDLNDRLQPSIFPTDENVSFAEDLFLTFKDRKKIFVVSGASTEQKMWPVDNWIDFLRPLVSDGWLPIMNGYGQREERIVNQILDGIGVNNGLNLVGKLDYLKMAAVVRECDAAIGNDTGPLHMAALSGVPTVGIFDYVQPIEVGYNMPWLVCAVGREKPLQTFYAKRRSQSILTEIKPSVVRMKFDSLTKEF
ncbi:MAG: glycosyltransferase family 9 protein [Synergistaceae bacterium]|nr:glycosyltransferase family 9 protein [Synergistaceae bacterium]